MKKTLGILGLGLFSLVCGTALSAQKIKYDKDTIRVDGKAYAVMKKKSAGPMRSDYAVSSLSGTELLYFKSMLRRWTGTGFNFGGGEELYYEANFIGTGSKADLKHYTGNGFAKLVVENNLIKGNAIDLEAEKRFIQLNNGYYPSTPVVEAAPSPAVIVNINNNNGGTTTSDKPAESSAKAPKSKTPVTLNGNQIIRDEVVIGKFKEETTSSSYSQKTRVLTIYNEDGEKVAEATVPVENPQEWQIKTLSDNKSSNIMYDAPGEKEKLFKWLADKNYLRAE